MNFITDAYTHNGIHYKRLVDVNKIASIALNEFSLSYHLEIIIEGSKQFNMFMYFVDSRMSNITREKHNENVRTLYNSIVKDLVNLDKNPKLK